MLEEFKLYEKFYRDRGRNPRDAIPQDQFVAQLNRNLPNRALPARS